MVLSCHNPVGLLQPPRASGLAFPGHPIARGRDYADLLALRTCFCWLADTPNPTDAEPCYLRFILPDHLLGRMTFQCPQEGYTSRWEASLVLRVGVFWQLGSSLLPGSQGMPSVLPHQ